MVQEARQEAWAEGYKRGLSDGETQGREDALGEITIDPEWKPAVQLINAVYTDPESVVPPQHVYQAPEQVQARAASWRQMRDSAAWGDVVMALTMDARRRLRDLVAGDGEPDIHRAVIALEEQLLGLPDSVIQYAEQLNEVDAG